MNHPSNKYDEWDEEEGILKPQMEVVEAENASLCTHIWSMHYAMFV